jgi:hypothetical protein
MLRAASSRIANLSENTRVQLAREFVSALGVNPASVCKNNEAAASSSHPAPKANNREIVKRDP